MYKTVDIVLSAIAYSQCYERAFTSESVDLRNTLHPGTILILPSRRDARLYENVIDEWRF